MKKTVAQAAAAHEASLAAQAVYTQDHKDRLASIGAPQRAHVAAEMLNVVLAHFLTGSLTARVLLWETLNLLDEDGYDRRVTWERMQVMARQPRRKLTPPKPRGKMRAG